MEPNTLKGWEEFPELEGFDFSYIVERHREITDQEAAFKIEKKELGSQIETALLVIGQKKVMYQGLTVMRSNGRTPSYIDGKKLAMHGVPADVIAACTVPGTSYTYAQVRKPSEKHEANDGE